MQLGNVLPTLPREKMIVQTKVAPKPNSEGISPDVRDVDEVSAARSRRSALAARHQQPRTARLVASKKAVASTPRANCRSEGRCRFVGFSTHATTDIILEAVNSGGFDYINLHWYFVNDLNWPRDRSGARARHGRVHHQPERQRRKTLRTAAEAGGTCARRSRRCSSMTSTVSRARRSTR